MHFTSSQRAYLAGQALGRLATVSPNGDPQNNPVTFRVRADDTIDIGGFHMGDTKKFRNIAAGSTRVAFVVDDIISRDPWTVRCLEIRGHAEALTDVDPPLDGMSRQVIRIQPQRVISYGI